MFLFTTTFWLIVQFGLDVLLVLLLIYLIRQVRNDGQNGDFEQKPDITGSIEAVLDEAKIVASEFDKQLKEKRQIMGRLVQELDSRIINLNLLLKRADLCGKSGDCSEDVNRGLHGDSYDLQKEIIILSEKGLTPEKIADQLGVIKGEVKLVLDLKKKFEEMQAI